jgi:hypothetical protein
MKTSESIKNLSAALNRAQKRIGAAVKGSANPFFKSRYADLGAVMEACKEHLNSEGISVLQPVLSDETGDYVETVLLHESGEFISSKMRLLPSKNMQELGSNTSYARRYGLQSLVFIPAEDDDGEAAMGRGKTSQVKTVPPSEPASTSTSATTPVTAAAAESPRKSSFKKSTTAAAQTTPPPALEESEAWE